MGVTVTVIGIFSFFCVPINYSAAMAPSVNDMRIHGCLVFHVVSALLARSALFGIKADVVKDMSRERQFLKGDFNESLLNL